MSIRRLARIQSGVWIFLVFLSGCSQPVIDSTWIQIEKPAFDWIHAIYFPEKTVEKAKDEIMTLMAENLLALKWRLREDTHYAEYMFREKRGRYYRALNWYGKTYIGGHFSPNDVGLRLGLLLDTDSALKMIVKDRRLEKGRVALSVDARNIRLGSFRGKELFLSHAEAILNKSEFRSLLVSKPSVSKEYLGLVSELLAAQKAYEFSIKKFGVADEEQVEWMDEAMVARSYLTVKYHYSMKGVYPTKKFRVEFTPAELYSYFDLHKNRYKKVLSFEYRATVVTGKSAAEIFLKRAAAGEPFLRLARQYAASPFFVSTARFRRLSVAEMKSEQSAVSLKKKIQSFALDMASKSESGPRKFAVTDKQFAIIEIRDIQYQNDNLKLRDVLNAVRHDMEEEIFREQFKVDLADTIRKYEIRK